MTTCNFCGNAIRFGTGKIFVKKDGKILNLCSSKCQKNLNLGREPKNVQWTLISRKERGKK